MAKIWKNRIEAGTQKLSECPKKYYDDVIELLDEDLKNGVITEEEYENIMNK